MVTTILSDFSRVIFNPKDKNYTGTLNGLHKELLEKNSNYIFFDYFEFNNDILNLYKDLRHLYSVNIFTTGTIQNRLEVREVINPIFEHIYAAGELGLNKKKAEAYLHIAQKLKRKPFEILFIDDQIENIDAANKAGIITVHYTNFKDTAKKIKELII